MRPVAIVDGALAAARYSGVGVDLVGRRPGHRGGTRAPSRSPPRSTSAWSTRPTSSGWASRPASTLRRKPRASIRVAAELRRRRRGVGAGQRRAHRGGGRGRPRRVRDAGGRRPAGAGAGHSHAARLGGAARRRRHRRVPAGPSAAVRRDGCRLRPHPARRRAPRVGLLSIGEEEGKGNDLTRDAHRLLKAAPLHFVGNVEARDIFSGRADVIVCDGFTGNVALKLSEGLVEMVEELLRRGAVRARSRARSATCSRGGPSGASASGSTTRSTAARRCWASSGLVLVCHGRSSAKAIRNAVVSASRLVADGVLGRVEQRVAEAMVAPR